LPNGGDLEWMAPVGDIDDTHAAFEISDYQRLIDEGQGYGRSRRFDRPKWLPQPTGIPFV